MAEITSPHTRFHSLQIANKGESLSWTQDGIRLPAMGRCKEIFAYLFEEPKDGIGAQRRLSVARAACLTPTSKKYANWIRKSAGKTADGWNNTSPRFAKPRSVPSGPMPGWTSPVPKSPRQTVSEPTGT